MTKKGFTFIELIVYVALMAIILNVGVYFVWQMIEGKAKNVAYLEVERNSIIALDKISYQAKKAKSIEIPGQGQENSQLTLIMPDDSRIRFYLQESSLFLEKNGNSAPLTNRKVVVEEIVFKNLSSVIGPAPSFPGSFQVKIKTSYYNPLTRSEYQAEILLQKTITLRDNLGRSNFISDE